MLDIESNNAALEQWGLDPDRMVDILLDPGDVVMWLPHTLHASGPNRSTIDRRAYVNGYVIADNCDRGEWAFKDGAPCELGEPVLVQYEELYTRPEPHYIEGPIYPVNVTTPAPGRSSPTGQQRCRVSCLSAAACQQRWSICRSSIHSVTGCLLSFAVNELPRGSCWAKSRRSDFSVAAALASGVPERMSVMRFSVWPTSTR